MNILTNQNLCYIAECNEFNLMFEEQFLSCCILSKEDSTEERFKNSCQNLPGGKRIRGSKGAVLFISKVFSYYRITKWIELHEEVLRFRFLYCARRHHLKIGLYEYFPNNITNFFNFL